MRWGGVGGLFDDVIGRGWTLLSSAGDPARYLDAETAAFFASLGGLTAQVGPGGPIEDLDSSYGRWFAAADAALVLQRPDFYVFGTAARLDEARALVERLRRALRLER